MLLLSPNPRLSKICILKLMATNTPFKKAVNPKCPNCPKDSFPIEYLNSINNFGLYLCEGCKTGFTYPIPKNMARYYHEFYWTTPGVFGRIKDAIFKFFQRRRIMWITTFLKKGNVLDVGAGEGNFINNLPDIFKGVGIDASIAKIKNSNIKRVDFLKWQTKEKFDAIVFWESLEHTTSPEKYLKKAFTLLKNKGLVFIEYPRFNSLESKIFGKHWFHLDIPRHSSHLTDKGLSIILNRVGFKPKSYISVAAFEYTLWGFSASFLSIFKIKPTDELKKLQNLMIIFSLIPLGIVALIFEVIFLPFKESPIGLVIASKKI